MHKNRVYIRRTDYKGRVFIILMSTPSAIHILTPVLKIKSADPNRGVKARAVVLQFSTSTWVTVPLGTITALLADIAEFNAATGPARKTIWFQINEGLKSVMGLFASLMGTDPLHAAEICVSGGFFVKQVNIKQKNVFTLKQGNGSGILICTGDTDQKAIFHAWWISRDGTNFTLIMGTPESENILTGLAPGRIWIQHQWRGRKNQNGPVKELFIDLI